MKMEQEGLMQPHPEAVEEGRDHLQEQGKSTRQRRGVNAFIYWTKEAQLQAFLDWLPQELHDAPGIEWAKLAPEVMGYCIHTINSSPDAAVLAVVAASLHGALPMSSQRQALARVNWLLRALRSNCGMQHLTDLKQVQIWHTWVAHQPKTEGTRQQAKAYASVATSHLPRYLLRLGTSDRLRMQQYSLPPLPFDLVKNQLSAKPFTAAQQAKRKAQTDILVPLYPILRQLIRFRKQLMERTLLTIREARRTVETGEAVLPFHFQHTDSIPEINRDARSISDVQIQGREVTMPFILWDRKTWVEHHPERYGDATRYELSKERRAYSPGQNTFFVQFDGKSSDLLWIGDLVEHRLLQSFNKESLHLEGYQERWQLARRLGFTNGCVCSRPGLLDAGYLWLTEVGHHDGDLVFEPEALYRAVLFGATLAMIAFSNGSRVSELLQVSWNKERRVTRTETIMLLDKDGLPQYGENNIPLTKQVKLHFQHLLPKGAKTEEERQLFPLSKEALRMIGEIKALLEEAHGEIPVVYPSRTSVKYEHLKPERYVFQWAAAADDTTGLLTVVDVQVRPVPV